MMMIKGTSTGTGAPLGDLHPGDRCTWTSTYNEAQKAYLITNAQFWPGAGALGLPVTIDPAVVGVVGKSGRFTPISG